MTDLDAEHEGRLLALRLVVTQLLAGSVLDLERLQDILAGATSAQIVDAETPEQRFGNAAASAATSEVNAIFAAATRCRRGPLGRATR